ncbi:ATP-binding protein [Edaphobacter sp. HDX4]|uniref:ATP-binding protein n=1 Tax=Edaphobacter sp. HDX4 TaxID=2794064 RepID=UPI002FE5BFA5
MRFIGKFRTKDGSELDIELAVCEALVNAIVHGNELDPSKRVYVTCHCVMDGEVCISIQDEGPGFDPGCVPDPIAPENLLLTSGRGIYLMKMFMDEVSFRKRGSVVQMRKNPNDSSNCYQEIRSARKPLFGTAT